MDDAVVVQIAVQAMIVTAKVASPILVVSLVIGFGVSLFAFSYIVVVIGLKIMRINVAGWTTLMLVMLGTLLAVVRAG